MDKYPVILFSKTTCYYSKMAKKVLDEKNVNYFVEEIEQREDTGSIQDALLKITGERTVSYIESMVFFFCLFIYRQH